MFKTRFDASAKQVRLEIEYTAGGNESRNYRKTYSLTDGKSVCEETCVERGISSGYVSMFKPHQSAYCDRFAAVVAANMTSEQHRDLVLLFHVMRGPGSC